MIEIRLPNGCWSYDPDRILGEPGGFGAVYAGQSPSGEAVAVKRLHLGAAQAAHRELTIAQDLSGRTLRNVVPVYDAGQDAETEAYFVVMPLATGNLEEHVRSHGNLPEAEAAHILLQIVLGLDEVAHLVHRDLKPRNILKLGAEWCIGDFGIARFVEESTSANTLKECLSPHFAAPEQWRNEHATAATDIYALGCAAYFLLTGSPPFNARSKEELQEKHLNEAPVPPASISPRFQTLLGMMLRKNPLARPSRQRVRTIMQQLGTSVVQVVSDPGLRNLATAAAAHERQRAAAEAEANRQRAIEQQRSEMASQAQEILQEVFDELARRVASSAPNAVVSSDRMTIELGGASLSISTWGQLLRYSDAFPLSHWDVITGSEIRAQQSSPQHTRSASLWYTRRNDVNADFRWYEVGYNMNPFMGKKFRCEPIALPPQEADQAHAPGMAAVQPSYDPLPIDDEDINAFCSRWAHILAEACANRLQFLPLAL